MLTSTRAAARRLNPLYFGATSKSDEFRAFTGILSLNPLYFGATSKSMGAAVWAALAGLNPLYFGATSKSTQTPDLSGRFTRLNPLYFGATSKSAIEENREMIVVLIPSISGLHLNLHEVNVQTKLKPS